MTDPVSSANSPRSGHGLMPTGQFGQAVEVVVVVEDLLEVEGIHRLWVPVEGAGAGAVRVRVEGGEIMLVVVCHWDALEEGAVPVVRRLAEPAAAVAAELGANSLAGKAVEVSLEEEVLRMG